MAIVGAVPRPRRRPARKYRQGRVCADGACATILSRYNASRLCSIHEMEPRPTGRDGRPIPVPRSAWRTD